MPEFCKVERDGRIFTVTIDRPEVMNALHPPANRQLTARRRSRWVPAALPAKALKGTEAA